MNKKLTAAAAAAAGALGAAHLALSEFVFFQTFHRSAKMQDRANEKKRKRIPASLRESSDERLEWFNAQSPELCERKDEKGRTLRAHFIPGGGRAVLIGAHGYRTSAMKDFRFLAKFYHDRGIDLFLADHPGAGESEGEMISFGFEESKALLGWIDYVRERFGDDMPIILHGFSMGASTAMLLSDDERILPNVRFIVADCGYTDMDYQIRRTLRNYGKHIGALMKTISAESKLLRGFSFGEVRPKEHVKNALVPIIFIHGSRDAVTPVEKSFELFDACGGEKDLLVVEGAGHMASYRKAKEEYETKISEFIEKYVKNENE